MFIKDRPMNEDEMRVHTPVVISCNEGRREVSAVQNIANKQIDRTFLFDKVGVFVIWIYLSAALVYFQNSL